LLLSCSLVHVYHSYSSAVAFRQWLRLSPLLLCCLLQSSEAQRAPVGVVSSLQAEDKAAEGGAGASSAAAESAGDAAAAAQAKMDTDA
jgi:hypothetical protein